MDFKHSEELLCWGMILPHESADRAHCRSPYSDTLQGASEHQELRRTVLLYHYYAALEPHAVNIRTDALLIPLVPGVGFSVRLSRNDGALWIACSPAQVRLLQSLQRGKYSSARCFRISNLGLRPSLFSCSVLHQQDDIFIAKESNLMSFMDDGNTPTMQHDCWLSSSWHHCRHVLNP